MRRAAFYAAAVALPLALVLAILWLARGGGPVFAPAHWAGASNLALDVRYGYDSSVFKPVAYDPIAEFPLRLDATDWSFYGKRIQGAGEMLAKEPGQMLFDFVASQQDDIFSSFYRLEPVGKPQYEDAHFAGQLAVHTRSVYKLTDKSPGWPAYFPASIGSADGALVDTAYVEGWSLFTKHDLFYFYAVAPRELTARERQLCQQMISRMQFNALIGAGTASGADAASEDKTDESDDEPATKIDVKITPRR